MKYVGSFIFFLFVLAGSSLHAWDDSPTCYKDFQKNFYKEDYLYEALGFHPTITQGDWNAINRELQEKVGTVPSMVKTQAAAMHRNPLDHPFQVQPAAALLREILFNILNEVLTAHNVQNQSSIRDIFDYIRSKQIDKIRDCFGDEDLFPK